MTERVVDLMAALEESLAKAKVNAVRAQKRRDGLCVVDECPEQRLAGYDTCAFHTF